LARTAGGQQVPSDAGRTPQALAALKAPDASDQGTFIRSRSRELEVAEGDVQAVGAAAPIAEVGTPQRAGEDHHLLLLLARAGVPGGERLPGYLSRQVLGDPPHPRVVRGAGRSSEPESRPAVEDEALRFGLGASAGSYSGLPPSQDCFLDRPETQRARRATLSGLLCHPPLHSAL
jgi:hypothetical protein